MTVPLLYFRDCPNRRAADAQPRARSGENAELQVSRAKVTTPEDADQLGLRGSPSILVDGIDPFADEDGPVGLSCRMYQEPDGTSGSPVLAQLRHIVGRG